MTDTSSTLPLKYSIGYICSSIWRGPPGASGPQPPHPTAVVTECACRICLNALLPPPPKKDIPAVVRGRLSSSQRIRPDQGGSAMVQQAGPSRPNLTRAHLPQTPIKYSDGLPVEVLFADGVSVGHIRTTTEISHITITNLPLGTTKEEVTNLLFSRFPPGSLKVLPLKLAPNDQSLLSAIIIDHKDGHRALDKLSGIQFKNVQLKFQLTPNGKEGYMLDNSPGDGDLPSPVINVMWDPPSAKAVIGVDPASRDAAELAVRRINDTVLEGRRLHACLKVPKLGRIFFKPLVMEIDRLPIDVTKRTVLEISGCSSVKSIKRRSYLVQDSLRRLRRDLDAVIPGGVKRFTHNDSSALPDGSVSVTIRLHTWKQAFQVYLYLFSPRGRYFGRLKPHLDLVGPYRYCVQIPVDQYKVLQNSINDIAQKQREGNGALLYAVELAARRSVLLQVVGDDKKTVGALKAWLEKLLAGEKFYVWHKFFESDASSVYFKCLSWQTGAWATVDKNSKFILLFGKHTAVESIKAMIKAKIDELGPYQVTLQLQERSLAFFLNYGAPLLRDWLGNDKVEFNLLSPVPTITVEGGEDAKHRVQSLVREALEAKTSAHCNTQCPICLADVTNPAPLHCGHAYCDGCLRHLLTTACDTRSFPLVCVADGGKCKTPLSMSVIQRYLTQTQLCQLFEVALSVYVETHPQEYRYCSTADCSQVYRVSKDARSSTCPSCFASTCASCHAGWHEWYTCKQWKARVDANEQDRLFIKWTEGVHDVKKCPQCQVYIEKVNGCHRIECRCGASICWKCMGIFPKDTIYKHMSKAHGGVFDVPD